MEWKIHSKIVDINLLTNQCVTDFHIPIETLLFYIATKFVTSYSWPLQTPFQSTS